MWFLIISWQSVFGFFNLMRPQCMKFYTASKNIFYKISTNVLFESQKHNSHQEQGISLDHAQIKFKW